MDVLLSRLINQCIAQDIIKSEDVDIYRYGFDLLAFSIVNIVLLLSLGFIIGKVNVVMFILLCYIPLQSLGGGYHAKTHTRCSLIMIFEMAIAIAAVEFLKPYILYCCACLSMACIFILAPVQHPNAPFGPVFEKKMKRFVRRFGVIIFLVMLLTNRAFAQISSCIAVSLILAGISLVLAAKGAEVDSN